MLMTQDPDLVKQMNSVRSSFIRSGWYTALRLHPTRDSIVSITDEGVHTRIRNRMSPGYSGKENLNMEEDIDQRFLELFSLLETKYISDHRGNYRPVDLSRIMTFFTLDVISTVAFGQKFGFLEMDDDPFGYIANLDSFLPAVILFGAWPELQKILQLPFLKPFLPKSTDKRGLGKVMGFAKDRVEERFRGEDPVKRQDMLQSFINHGLTMEELESETITQITAGSDSTSTALRMTLHYISTTPAILLRLLREVNDAMAAGKVSRPMIKDVEARQLPYLQACIKEGLRMYPPVNALLAKEVPKNGVTIDGKLAPGGTWIAVNSFGMMRDKAIFGEDVDIFRPERWLAEDKDHVSKDTFERMNETVRMVFGYGRFACLGQSVAFMELNKGIIEVSLSLCYSGRHTKRGQTLLRFDLQPVNLAKPFHERCIGFYLHTDMNFRVTIREPLH